MKRFMPRISLLCAIIVLSSIHLAYGAGYNFITVDYPGAVSTNLNGINNSGQTVGSFGSSTWPYTYGFIRDSSGNFTNTLTYQNAFVTDPRGINNNDTIVGTYMVNIETPPQYGGYPQGFQYQGGVYNQITYPGAPSTWAHGINDSGTIVGANDIDPTNYRHAFVKNGVNFQSLDILGAFQSGANGINNSGQIVGFIDNSTNTLVAYHGFFRDSGGNATQLDFPSASATWAMAINNMGQIVGSYYDTVTYSQGGGWSLSGEHGFLLNNSVYLSIDFPGAVDSQLNGINDDGWLVGTYWDGTQSHGYIAQPLSDTVPEPSTFLLLGAGLGGLALLRRKSRKQ